MTELPNPTHGIVDEDGRIIDEDAFATLISKTAKSFLFFVISFCWIENKTESGVRMGESRFNLWPAQRPVAKIFLKHTLISILKARQLGLTWLTAAYCLWRCITRRGFLAVVISAKEDWAIEFLDRVRFMHNRLPSWLQKDLYKDGSDHMRFVFEWDAEGKKPLVYSDIKSLTTTPEGAQSKTPDLLVLDETARNRYASQIYGASKPGIDKAGGQIIVISNAHKRGPGWAWTREICAGARKGDNTFYFLFMPWWDCPERLTDTEKQALADDPRFVPSHFKKQQVLDGVDEVDVSENYPDTPEEALAPVAGSYFGDTLSRHNPFATPGLPGTIFRDKTTKELYYEVKQPGFSQPGGGIFTIWRYPYFLTNNWDGEYYTARYCLGADVSEGQGRSFSVAYVIDRYLDEPVLRIRSNRIDAVDWARLLWITSNYYPNFHLAGDGSTVAREPSMICVEKTGAGLTTVKELEKVGANQFVRTLHGKVGDHTTPDIGWHEDRQAKHILCADLKNWYKTMRGHVYCPVLLEESTTTIEHESGVIGPESGKMWDSVVAAGCALQASLQYGGPPTKIRRLEYTPSDSRSNWAL